ncbi:unnamed protein product [Symbiodinium natans]|uniref:Uncharacterized protein n=1 Tax=Symbiodinium natans TaxID=878477 RepID=A0A812RKZ2_9DINO|nr:unnamed protein product [Symbiodinium natans]
MHAVAAPAWPKKPSRDGSGEAKEMAVVPIVPLELEKAWPKLPSRELMGRRRRWSSSRSFVGLLGALGGLFLATRSQETLQALAHTSPMGTQRKWFFLLLFGLVDVGQAFVIDWAEGRTSHGEVGRRYVRQSVLVVEPFFAIVVGLAVQGNSGGLEAVRECLDYEKFLEFVPVCLFFGVGMSMKMRAVGYFNAGTIKIFGQLRLPLVALVSAHLLSRHYSQEQWQAISMVALSCFLFMWLKERQDRNGKANDQVDVRGLVLLAGWILLNVLGGVFAERAYKSGDKPFFSKKVSEDFGYLVLNCAMLFVMPCCDVDENIFDRQRRPGCLFDSWDRRTVAMVVMLMLDATASNWLLQEFSALTKSIMKACCVAIIYFMSLTYATDRDSRPWSCSLLNFSALMVVGCSLHYARVASSH